MKLLARGLKPAGFFHVCMSLLTSSSIFSAALFLQAAPAKRVYEKPKLDKKGRLTAVTASPRLLQQCRHSRRQP